MTEKTGPTDSEVPQAVIPEKAPEPEQPARRSLLGMLMALGSAAVAALLAIPLVRFAIYPLFAQAANAAWSDLGPVSDYASLSAPVQRLVTIQQVDGWRSSVSQRPVYITRNARGQLEVLSAVCPHLGCDVPWQPAGKEFHCPCHNSVFRADGSYVSGPAPRGMDSLPTNIQNGRLMVRYESFRQLVSYQEVIG